MLDIFVSKIIEYVIFFEDFQDCWKEGCRGLQVFQNVLGQILKKLLFCSCYFDCQDFDVGNINKVFLIGQIGFGI